MSKNVFLCHNSKEKAEVEKIRAQLLQIGIDAWLDKYDFEPFRRWQVQLEEIIPQIKAVAVFIGSSGVGPWANIEISEFLVEFAENPQLRMGLVILPGCPDEALKKVPRFMKGFHWVDFRQQDPEPMEQLIWGITGIRPTPQIIQHSSSLTTPSQPNKKALDLLNSHLSVQPNISAVQAGEIFNSYPGIQPPTATDNLDSEKGIDYTRLRDLLAAENWKEADEETYRVMIKAVGKEDGDWFTEGELLNFPCTDLRTIDRLWVKYSNGHFGFSVQKEIYLRVGGKADGEDYAEAWKKFGDRVGWRVNSSWDSYSKVTYNTSSPRGHLPNCLSKDDGSYWGRKRHLLSHRDL